MIKQQPARTLLWFSVILLVVGAVITDPAAGFALIALAGLGTLGIIVLGDKRLKTNRVPPTSCIARYGRSLLDGGQEPLGEVSGAREELSLEKQDTGLCTGETLIQLAITGFPRSLMAVRSFMNRARSGGYLRHTIRVWLGAAIGLLL